MKIGSFKHKITIQTQATMPDGMGGNISTWEDEATVSAGIWPVSASEQVQAMQNVMTISHRIRIRYRSILKASSRIKYGERYFNIVSVVNPNEENRLLDLICKEATA